MGKAKKKKKGLLNRFYRFIAKILILFFVATLFQVLALRFIDPPFTTSILILHAKNLFSTETYIIPKGEWRDLKDLSPSLVKAVLASEDQKFMDHHGFDFRELKEAVKDIFNKSRVRGASTITMQTSRTIFLWRDRSITRKVMEAYYTVLIEFVMPKVRILELYLNTVDWGSGIIGAEAAAKKYFNKSAADLTDEEAALLAAILPSPHVWSPVNPSRQVLARQKRILKSMGRMHL